MSFTLAVAVAMDGTKLTLFVFLNARGEGMLRSKFVKSYQMELSRACSRERGWTTGRCVFGMINSTSHKSLIVTGSQVCY